jgi:hypothetical protein
VSAAMVEQPTVKAVLHSLREVLSSSVRASWVFPPHNDKSFTRMPKFLGEKSKTPTPKFSARPEEEECNGHRDFVESGYRKVAPVCTLLQVPPARWNQKN